MKNKVKITIALVVIIVILVIVFNKNSKDDPSNIILLPEPTDTNDVIINEGLAKDWETCRNEEYGYEFKYPKEWHLYQLVQSEELPSGIIKISSCQGRHIIISQHLSERGGFMPPNVKVGILTQEWNKSLEEYLQSIDSEFSPVEIIESSVVDGINIVQYTKTRFLDEGFSRAVLLHEGNVIGVTFDFRNFENQVTFLSTILRSFKFIE